LFLFVAKKPVWLRQINTPSCGHPSKRGESAKRRIYPATTNKKALENEFKGFF